MFIRVVFLFVIIQLLGCRSEPRTVDDSLEARLPLGLSVEPQEGISALELNLKVVHASEEVGGKPELILVELSNPNDKAVRIYFKDRFSQRPSKQFPDLHKRYSVEQAIRRELVFKTEPFAHIVREKSVRPGWFHKIELTPYVSKKVLQPTEKLSFRIELKSNSEFRYLPVRSGRYRLKVALCAFYNQRFGFSSFDTNQMRGRVTQPPPADYRVGGIWTLPGATSVHIVKINHAENRIEIDRGRVQGVRIGDVFKSTQGHSLTVIELRQNSATCKITGKENRSSKIRPIQPLTLIQEGPLPS